MDKKTGIILGIIATIVVVLLTVVFVVDDNTEKLGSDTIFVVNGEKYSAEEFKDFVKIAYHESGDINAEVSYYDAESLLNNFMTNKILYNTAVSRGVKVDEESLKTYEDEYSGDEAVLLAVGVSKDDYMKHKEEEEMIQTMQYDYTTYFTLPDEIYEEERALYETNGMYNTYEFRLLSIPYEEKVSEDESGDATSGDATSGDEIDVLESGDKEDLSKEAQLKVAEDVLSRIKSGEDFEGLAKEYGSSMYFFMDNGLYMTKNGEIEYATTPMLERKLFGNQDLINTVKSMQSGDLSEIIVDETNSRFQILKVEKVEDGFLGDAEKELKEYLLGTHLWDIIIEKTDYKDNPGAFSRILRKL